MTYNLSFLSKQSTEKNYIFKVEYAVQGPSDFSYHGMVGY